MDSKTLDAKIRFAGDQIAEYQGYLETLTAEQQQGATGITFQKYISYFQGRRDALQELRLELPEERRPATEQRVLAAQQGRAELLPNGFIRVELRGSGLVSLWEIVNCQDRPAQQYLRQRSGSADVQGHAAQLAKRLWISGG